MTSQSPIKILVVDDEAPLMTALSDTLRDQGYETRGFTTAQDALECLKRERFDLMITDLMMPGMDGIALLRSAKELDQDLGAIVITGEGTIATAVEAMKAGAVDYILKPFKLSFILPVLTRALDLRRLRIENAELNQSLKQHAAQLEEANRELETFSYSISHDLRSPLRHVDGFSHLLVKQFGKDLPPPAQDLLNGVVAGTKRLQQMIDDLLRLSRFGRASLNPVHVQMNQLVRDVAAECAANDQTHNPEVRIQDLPDCTADPSLLRHVLMNLISNAFKFTRRAEKPLIEVGGMRHKQHIAYFVKDNGVGFDREQAVRLFGAFQRFHRNEDYEGTGVGLSIVHRIIRHHGGRIWAESAVNKGATFHFTLPAA